MLDRTEFPAALVDLFEKASQALGERRAAITLQGVVARYWRLRYIDGRLNEETLAAVRGAIVQIGADRLIELFEARLKERFPEFTRPVEVPVETFPDTTGFETWQGDADVTVIPDESVEDDIETAEQPKARRRKRS